MHNQTCQQRSCKVTHKLSLLHTGIKRLSDHTYPRCFSLLPRTNYNAALVTARVYCHTLHLMMSACVQATAAAVQTTHLLRLSAAVLLIMTLRAAKSLIYGGTDVAGWQRALTHVYAIPPLVLLTLLQLSAIFLFARMYHDTPSTIPSKVCSHCNHMLLVKCIIYHCSKKSFPQGLAVMHI